MGARDLMEEGAQATVEAAVVLPVLIVLALISFNLMRFSSAVARFDRLAPDMVLAHGVSPEGDSASLPSACRDIERELVAAMDDPSIEVSVRALEDAADGGVLSMAGSMVTFRCVMAYRPWPTGLAIAGVDLGSPFALERVREVAVDPWRPGVVA